MRATHNNPDCSLADLYDELTMPSDFHKAHKENDKAVMEAYDFSWRTMSESECVAELFKLFQKISENRKKSYYFSPNINP